MCCDDGLVSIWMVCIGLIFGMAAVGPIIVYTGQLKEKSYHLGVCVVTSSHILNATNCFEPVANIHAHEGGQSSYVETLTWGICYRLYNESLVSPFFDDHPIGSSDNCYWWVSYGRVGPAQYADSIPDGLVDNAALIAMCVMVIIAGVCLILSLVFVLLACGCCRGCYNCYGTCYCGCCCDRVKLLRHNRLNKPVAKYLCVCTKCDRTFDLPKPSNTSMCPECTVIVQGVNEFLGSQGSQLQSFVAGEVIELCVHNSASGNSGSSATTV
jgi:hypothetical protein